MSDNERLRVLFLPLPGVPGMFGEEVVKAVSKKKTHHHNPFGGVIQNVVQKHFREDFRARRVDATRGGIRCGD